MKRQIRHIVIHCTATRQDATVTAIQHYWRTVLGWRNPGYHYLIPADGTIHQLQPLDRVANGVRGHNAHAIHISYIGGQSSDDRTRAQRSAIEECILRAQAYASPAQPEILGHRDFPGVRKACPQFNARVAYIHLLP